MTNDLAGTATRAAYVEAAPPPRQYGTCRNCAQGVRLLKGGFAREHKFKAPYGRQGIATYSCPGSGRRCAEDLHFKFNFTRGEWERTALPIPVWAIPNPGDTPNPEYFELPREPETEIGWQHLRKLSYVIRARRLPEAHTSERDTWRLELVNLASSTEVVQAHKNLTAGDQFPVMVTAQVSAWVRWAAKALPLESKEDAPEATLP